MQAREYADEHRGDLPTEGLVEPTVTPTVTPAPEGP
jgi:hypothetical protein